MATLTAASALTVTVALVASHAGDANAALSASGSLGASAVVFERELTTDAFFTNLPAYTSTGVIEGADNPSLPAYTAEGVLLSGSATTSEGTLPSYTSDGACQSGGAITVEADLPAYICECSTGNTIEATLPAYTAEATAVPGKLLSGEADLPSITCSAESSVDNIGDGASSLSLPAYTLESNVIADNDISVSATLGRIALAAEGYSGTVGTVDVTLPAYTVTAEGYGEYVGDVSVTLPMLELQATISDSATTADPGVSYAMNLKTRALTKFDVGFNSLTVFDGTALAANANGLFAISGESDNGVAISASLKTVLPNEGMVRAREAYVNCRTDGDVVLQVIPDEGDDVFEYTLAKFSDKLTKQKVKLGRGMRAENWDVVISNRGGADFEIDYIEILNTPTRRKT